MTLDWFHFCEYSFSTSDGKPGVIGIHDRILVDDVPAAIPFGFAFQLRTQSHLTASIDVAIVGPDGSKMTMKGTRTANFDGAVLVQFSVALTVPKAGRYTVELAADGVQLQSQSILVLIRQPLETAPGKTH